MDLDSTLPTDSMTLRLVGNEVIDQGDRLCNFDGGIQHLRIQNNHVLFRDDPIVVGVVSAPVSSTLPIYVTHNRLTDAGGCVDLQFNPADANNGSAVDVLVEYNEVRYGDDAVIDLDDLAEIGANGSVNLIMRHNTILGVGDYPLTLQTVDTGVGPFAGVSCTIEVHDNVILNGDEYALDVDLGTSASQTASIEVNDNFFGPMEDEILTIDDSFSATADLHDQGTIIVKMKRNVGTGGSSSFLDYQMGPPQGGDLYIWLEENTFRKPDDYGIEIDFDNVQGTTTATYNYPDAGRCFLTIFNNDIHGGGDYEAYYLDDSRGTNSTTAMYTWIGHNYGQADGDASDGAFYLNCQGPFGSWVCERNVGLGSGQDDNEVGLQYESGEASAPSTCVCLNNIATGGFGGGFQQSGNGPWMQLINNTAAFSGSEDDDHGGFSFDETNRAQGDAQLFILNCIASDSGGQDVDYRDGMITAYSLVKDAFGDPAGFMNLAADPVYAKSFTDLMFPLDVSQFADMFTLESTSPAVNAGHPATRYNDPDGSRNDMGAFGGPGSGAVGVLPAGADAPLAFVSLAPLPDLHTGATLIAPTQAIDFVFNQPVDLGTLPGNLGITNGGVGVAGTTASFADGRIIRFTPTTVLNPTSGTVVDVSLGTGLMSTAGTSMNHAVSFRFAVTGTPVAEVEANDDGVAGITAADMTAAQAVVLPGGSTSLEITGTMAAADDVDVYAVTLNAGERLMVTVLNGRAVGGTADEFDIGIHDASGRRIRMGRRGCFTGAAGDDPYLDWVVEATGTYYIALNLGSGAGTPAYTLQAVIDTLD